MEKLVLRSEYITLGQLLKAMGLVYDGVEAKIRIQSGEARVNGEVDTRRGRKLYDGDVVEFAGSEIAVVKK
jgi:ribosome-associated protein